MAGAELPDIDPAILPTAPPPASLGLLLTVLGLCSFASTVSMRLVDPVVPLLASGFDIGLTQAAMLVPIFTLSYAFGQPFIGPVADAFGKVRIIAIALAVLAVLQWACALAPGFQSLAVLRGLAGIAAGGIIPVAMAAVADRVDMANRQVALSRLLAMMVTGQVCGSLMSGLIGDYAGWRMAFVVAGMVAGAVSLLVILLLKPRARADREAFSAASAVGRYKTVLANPQSWRLCLLVTIEAMAIFAIFPFAAELLQQRGAVGAAEAGAALAVFGLGGLIYTVIARPLVDRLGPARMAVVGGVILAAVLTTLSLPLPRWSAPVLFGFMGFGFYLIHSTYQTQATELSTTARSSAMALFACALFLGTAMGPVTLAALRQVMALESTLLVYAVVLLGLGLVSSPVLGLRKLA
jgi:MFS transporter, YNFM family, putative membrane transport protein